MPENHEDDSGVVFRLLPGMVGLIALGLLAVSVWFVYAGTT